MISSVASSVGLEGRAASFVEAEVTVGEDVEMGTAVGMLVGVADMVADGRAEGLADWDTPAEAHPRVSTLSAAAIQ